MLYTQPCAALWADGLTQLYAFLKSDSGELFFAALAIVKTAVYYCYRSRYLEARELAATMVLALAFTVTIIAQETQVPIAVRQILACKGPSKEEPRLARNALHPGAER
jgi:hypothetical protein